MMDVARRGCTMLQHTDVAREEKEEEGEGEEEKEDEEEKEEVHAQCSSTLM